MSISKVYAILVYPTKNGNSNQSPHATEIPQTGKLFDLAKRIYESESDGRDFEIIFNPRKDGVQQNDCRDLMIKFQLDPSAVNGVNIADRLQSVTDNRSGIGLLFLITGTHAMKGKLVISRFPTDEAILADFDGQSLNLEFLDRVFIKRMTSYKALSLEDEFPSDGFWIGKAIDRQAGSDAEGISDYWIRSFLNADFSETPAQGTKRLVDALKSVIKSNPNLEVKSQIVSATSLAASVFASKNTSIKEFCEHFGFNDSSKNSVINALKNSKTYEKEFMFDAKEFQTKAPYRTTEVDNGAILSAPTNEFEDIFEITQLENERVKYVTIGRVSDQRLSIK